MRFVKKNKPKLRKILGNFYMAFPLYFLRSVDFFTKNVYTDVVTLNCISFCLNGYSLGRTISIRAYNLSVWLDYVNKCDSFLRIGISYSAIFARGWHFFIFWGHYGRKNSV